VALEIERTFREKASEAISEYWRIKNNRKAEGVNCLGFVLRAQAVLFAGNCSAPFSLWREEANAFSLPGCKLGGSVYGFL